MENTFLRQHTKTGQTRPFLDVTKQSSILPHVVWAKAKESKNGLRFEIEPSYDDVPMTFQCPTDGQSSCRVHNGYLGDK